MDKEAFEALFQERISNRLAGAGFQTKAKTVYLFNDRITIALLRLGGRMMRPGSIAHVLCFRHSFLRDMKEKIPASLSDNAFYYPYKLKPYEEGGREPSYRPLNLNVDYEYLQWDDADESRVTQRLDRIAANIEDCFLPWANGVDPATVKSELIEHGEGAWCERMWIDDYAARSDADRLRAPQIAP